MIIFCACRLDASNILDVLLKQSPPSDIAFPPTLRKPSGDELLEVRVVTDAAFALQYYLSLYMYFYECIIIHVD